VTPQSLRDALDELRPEKYHHLYTKEQAAFDALDHLLAQLEEIAPRIDRYFDHLRHDPPPLIGAPETHQKLLYDIREALR
jgi:hypothetical protein